MRAEAHANPIGQGAQNLSPVSPLEIRNYIRARRQLRGTPRAVLQAIGDSADWEGEEAGSSSIRLCELSDRTGGLCRRAIQKALRVLEGLGEIVTEKRIRADGSQAANRYRLAGLFAAREERKSNRRSPPRERSFAPILPTSNSEGIPLTPERTSAPCDPKPPRQRRAGGGEDQSKLLEIGAEARRLFCAHAPASSPKPDDTPAAKLWLGRRVAALGGLAAFEAMLKRLASSAWVIARGLGAAFFTSLKTRAALEAGAYGCKASPAAGKGGEGQGTAPSGIDPERLKKRPWLAYLADFDLRRRRADTRAVDRAAEEAHRYPIFGREREIFALWRLDHPAAPIPL